MPDTDYLFPRRLTRRDFLQTSGAAAAGLVLSANLPAQETPAVTIGEGAWRYTLDPNWGNLPNGMTYGFGCAIVVDSKDRIFVTSRSESPCVAVFDAAGQLLETWSKDFADKVGATTAQVKGTAHGLYWSKEGDQEFFYFTENSPGNRVYKTDLTGKVLYTLGKVAKEDSTSQAFKFDNPTDVAVAPNGDVYVVDGYGSQLVHRFDKDFKLIKTIGGRGQDHGKFNVCHGVWINTLKGEPEVYVADRHNNRIEVYSPELEYKRTIADIRTPCCFYQHDGHLYVPELGSRVSILDKDDKYVARLGDGLAVKAAIEKSPDRKDPGSFKAEVDKHPEAFLAPHALTLDSKGNLYVLEWLPFGRPRKFTRTPA